MFLSDRLDRGNYHAARSARWGAMHSTSTIAPPMGSPAPPASRATATPPIMSRCSGFTPMGSATWVLTEYHPEDERFFGLCDLGMGSPELVSREEIEQTVKPPLDDGARGNYFCAPSSLPADGNFDAGLYSGQPDEIERPACACCGSFLRHGTSILRKEGHAGYAVMHCVVCGCIQWMAYLQEKMPFSGPLF